MDIFETSLIAEYKRLCAEERDILKELKILPMGSIQKKKINGREYFYRQFREGGKVKSKYIKPNEIEELKGLIEVRKVTEMELRYLRKKKSKIESLCNRDKMNVEIVKEIVRNVIPEYPGITKVYLFGSRAGSDYRIDSDVDLIFESDGAVSLFLQSEIRLRLEEALGLPVDFVHGPIKETDVLQVGRMIELYAA